MPLIIDNKMIAQIDDMARKRAKLLWHIRDGIMTARNVAWMQIEVVGNGWLMHKPHHWMLFSHEGGELYAEIFLSAQTGDYTAIIWLPDCDSECGSFDDGYKAILWCGEKIRDTALAAFASVYRSIHEHAAALNAKAERLERTGAVDASESGMWDEHLQYGH